MYDLGKKTCQLNTSDLSGDEEGFTNQKTSTPVEESSPKLNEMLESSPIVFSEMSSTSKGTLTSITSKSELGFWPMSDSSSDDDVVAAQSKSKYFHNAYLFISL